MKLKKLIGHEQVYQNLVQHFSNKISSSSWIISGKKSIGKSLLVHKLVNQILASDVDYETHPDIMIIRPVDNKDIAIDEIRSLHKFIRLSPAISDYKIVIIDDSDRLNINASNALLKILEEPHNCIFFLICHNLAKLPSTILSRCRKIKLKNLNLEESLEIVQEDVDPVAMRKILLLTQNSQDLALKLHALDILKIYKNLMEIILSLDNMNLSKINKWYDSFKGDDQWEIFSLLINRLVMQIIKCDYGLEYITDLEKETIENIRSQCNMESLIDLWERLQTLLQETTNSYLDQKQVILVIFQLIQRNCGFKK